ncbi:cyclic AMP-dependent transcription factor ATF-7-like [Pollicipes pollicipes]|uniref:cyclic AMP-dependent transcription factor ATF-7-like n=1 Tax=Pollicipes pollicipes TaxID=41117 RepID=UPI00188576DD|nr:cyclic AMP-dependent transcription factor ATF-7-like [Pollicipes pollicipes]
MEERLKQTLQRQEKPAAAGAAAERSPPVGAHPALGQAATPTEDSLRRERNRAAANRWRARKKRDQQQMASSMESLSLSVRQLRRENGELRAEVAKLKLLLIQHRECDVTRGLRPLAEADGLGHLELEAFGRPEEAAARPAPLPLVLAAPVSAMPVQAGATHQLILVSAAGARPVSAQPPSNRLLLLCLSHAVHFCPSALPGVLEAPRNITRLLSFWPFF